MCYFNTETLTPALAAPDSALEKIQKAVALNPDLTGRLHQPGGLLLAAGRLDSAEAAVRKALDIDPYDATAYNAAGRILASKGQATEALFDFAKAARLKAGYGPYLYDYALMLVRLNRLDEAQEQAEAAVQGDPDFAAGHDLLGGLLARKSQLTEAASEYQKAVEIQPDFSRAQLDLGLVLAAQGDLPGATEHLRKAAQGKDPEVAQRAAQALERLVKH